MISKIVMPPGGQTTETSTVVNWLVKVGDVVKRGDIILEIETDKAVLSVESFAAGTVIDILVPEGNEASEGDVLALIGNESDAKEYKKEEGHADGMSVLKAATTDEDDGDEYQPIMKNTDQGKKAASAGPSALRDLVTYQAMPNAKKAAIENGIDISAVTPANGSVIKLTDVLSFIERKGAKPSASSDADYEIMPISKMRQTIAKRMMESVRTIPAYQETVELNMKAAIALRKEIKKSADVSFNDIIMRCLCVAIKMYPLINATFTDKEIRIYRNVNIGLAVSVEGGLVVPVIRNAGQKSIAELAGESKAYIDKARSGALQPQDIEGGTITLSNIGMYPIDHFSAIINPPESCILAIGQIRELPVWKDGHWIPTPTVKLTATFDHRVIDGAYGAQFLSELKKLIETPSLAL